MENNEKEKEHLRETIKDLQDQLQIAQQKNASLEAQLEINQRLFGEAQKRLQAQNALLAAVTVISSTLDLQAVLNHIVEQLVRAVDCTSAYISSYDQVAGTSTVLAEYYGEAAGELERVSDVGVTYDLADDFPGMKEFLKTGEMELRHLDNFDENLAQKEHLQNYGAQTDLFIPLQVGGRTTAFIDIWESRWRREFSREEINLCRGIGQQAAVAMENARLFAEVQNKLQAQQAIYEAVTVISSSLDLQSVLDHLVQQLISVLKATSAYFCTFDEATGVAMVMAEAFGEGATASERVSDLGAIYALHEEFPAVSETLKKGSIEVTYVDDEDMTQSLQSLLLRHGARTILRIPLQYAGKTTAYVSIWDTRFKRVFLPAEIDLCQSIAQHAAFALENARLYDEVQKYSLNLEQIVSERTRELTAVNQQLRLEINERKNAQEALATYARELERSNQELQSFAYVASHDLQEPLRKIKAFSDRLLSLYDSDIDERGLDYLARMQNAADRMQQLIMDLLAYSRVTTQAKPFTAVDLHETVTAVLTDLEMIVEESGAEVYVGDLPRIEADATQMRQLFQNLISNAIKFRQMGVWPVIHIDSVIDSDAGIVQIAVRDNGIGFEEKYLDRIFSVFQRLHGRHEYEGTGVGLAICRKIVDRHQGTITAKSELGKGATFLIRLPLRQSQLTPLMVNE